MGKVIEQTFYSQNTVIIAKNILGMILCRKLEDGNIYKGRIVEAEAYTQEEESCHAYKGITKRSATMFKAPGTAYVYMTYGMYHCLNIITEREGFGSGVLIRALEPIQPKDILLNGPGKLCREFKITKELNEINVCTKKSGLWLEYGEAPQEKDIIQTVRIGIKLAMDLPWRFYIKNNKSVSKP